MTKDPTYPVQWDYPGEDTDEQPLKYTFSTPAKKETGGPAFAQTTVKMRDNITASSQFQGMTLLDWFAGCALSGLTSNGERYSISTSAKAYDLADAMIAERDRQ